jgi:hypothetical protein
MKTLRPGPRPFYALGGMSALLLLFLVFGSFTTGDWKLAGYGLLFPVLVLAPLALIRVEVDTTEIRLRNLGVVWKRARFEDIGRSFANVLAEEDWPVSLTIIGKDGQTVLMTVRTKMLRKEDVGWLLARPELKVTR